MQMTDEELVERARSDDDAFWALMQQHRGRLWRAVWRITRSADETEEIVHQASIAAWCGLADFEGRSGVGTWLMQLAVNRAINVMNHREVEQRADELAADPEWERVEPVAERAVWSREIYERIERELQRLSEEERKAFLLRHVAGKNSEEIGTRLGVGPSGARMVVHRAVGKLRASLKELVRSGHARK